ANGAPLSLRITRGRPYSRNAPSSTRRTDAASHPASAWQRIPYRLLTSATVSAWQRVSMYRPSASIWGSPMLHAPTPRCHPEGCPSFEASHAVAEHEPPLEVDAPDRVRAGGRVERDRVRIGAAPAAPTGGESFAGEPVGDGAGSRPGRAASRMLTLQPCE